MRRVCLTIFLATLAGCGQPADGPGPACVDDGHELGPPCRERIETEEQFIQLAAVSPDTGRPLGVKFMLPATDDPDLLPIIFQNSKRYRLHICLLCCEFPELFGAAEECDNPAPDDCKPGMTTNEYQQLIMRRNTRSYFAGTLHFTTVAGEGNIYGFDVWVDSFDDNEVLDMKETRAIYEALHAVFLPEKLVFWPRTDPRAADKARNWIDPDFPVYLEGGSLQVEVYTPGVAYGRVRGFSLEEMEGAVGRGELGFQDIVVVDRVPFDVEAVLAGIITGGRQWELSHVNVRMARRGTPNLYVKEALVALEEYEGKLVRLEAESNDYDIEEVSLAEAEQWWAAHRPDAGPPAAVDRDYRAIEDLLELDTDDQPVALVSRIGGKAANLARLYALLPAEYRVPAFAIPFAYFEDFMRSNTLTDPGADPPREVTYTEYVEELARDEEFSTDSAWRRDVLWDLRSRMLYEAQLDEELVAALAQMIVEIFGDSGVRVRFRSSSNAEDALEFSGAGLYDSTTVCAADSLDTDRDGPSRCDVYQDEERSIERGLRRVWASLYNARAWEERQWYQMPQEEVSMAILVSRAFPLERANGVAFTGNPNDSEDDDYLVNVQQGDEPVVGNDPRMVPERDFLTLDDSGEVTRIERSRSSALSGPGVYVLSDEQLAELGGLLFGIDRDFPLDSGPYFRRQILLDFEFKIDGQGRLKLKQVRPFLDKCRGVTCNDPPDDYCEDEKTLIDYYAWGECDAQTGECSYDYLETECPKGCIDGECVP